MARRNDHPRVWARLAVALGAALLLGLAAVAMHAAQGTAMVGEGPAKHMWPLLALGLIALALVLAGSARRAMDRVSGTTPTQARVASLVVPGAALMALATLVGLVVLGTHGATFPQPTPTPQGISANGQGVTSTPTVGQTPGDQVPQLGGAPQPALNLKPLLYGFLILLAVALVGLLVFLLVRWLMARRALGGADADAVEGGLNGDDEALAEAVQAGQDALAEESDPRTAIIACYAAMERSLAQGGVSRQKADTPTDLLRRAAEADLVQGVAAQTLTDLFSEARYSTHPMGEHQRDQAQAALTSISTHLAAARAETDARFGALEEIEI